ncbi:MAG: VWA-like domain-containing protein [Oliverpabstia sp.]
MVDKDTGIRTMDRMKSVRRMLIKEYPFYGELIMNLNLAVAEVGTACTDGKYLIIDPLFAGRLSDEELLFLYMHEVMHIVFFHCFRRRGRDKYLWNIACDYVVNSNILMSMGMKEFSIDKTPVMHQIRGVEAYQYTAEEIYKQLTEGALNTDNQKAHIDDSPDSHEIWDELETAACNEAVDRWGQIAFDATKKWYGKDAGIAAGSLKRYKETLYKSQLKWKQIVRDFIRYRNTDEDYGFRPSDRRFQDEEFIYPGLNQAEAEVIEYIWFFIDKSGSISRKMLLDVIREIEYGLRQVKNMSGLVSFFDTEVTKPIPFADLKDFMKVGIPLPDGGTRFHSIFTYVKENRKRYNPEGIIILTDGYAKFPESNSMPRLPVLWVIVNNRNAKPSFGRCVYINS